MQPELALVALHPGDLQRHIILGQTQISPSAPSSYLLPGWSLTLGVAGGTVIFRVTGCLLRLSSFLFLLSPNNRIVIILPQHTYNAHFNLFFSLSSTELSEICCFFLILSFLRSSLAASSSASSWSSSGYFLSRRSGVA